MDRLLLKALGTAYRKHFPIDPVLTPRMQALLLRIAAAEAKPGCRRRPETARIARLLRASALDVDARHPQSLSRSARPRA